MIRVAKFADTPAIEGLLSRAHARSKYFGRTGINLKALNDMVMGLIAGQNQKGPQATYMVVAEQDEEVSGFMAGALSRAYNFLDGLVATDVFLINEGGPIDAIRMVDGYLNWARGNPKVIEIGLSWSDALIGGEAAAKLYKRLGAKLVGEQYEIRLDMEQPGEWERTAA
jgi:hypothetical protein